MGRAKDEGGSAVETLRAFGLRYPGAHTKSPWPGHLDLAVKDKTFVYLSLAGEPLSISCKLPQSAEAALSLPFTTPTAYGLGKSGWVTATFPDGTAVPVELLREWIDESYRAQAPKRMSAGLPPLGTGAGEPLSLESSEAGSPDRQGSTVKQSESADGDGSRPARRVARRAAAKAPAAKAASAKAAAKRAAGKASPAKAPAVKRAAEARRAAAKAPAAKPPTAKGTSKPKASRVRAAAARASATAGTAARRAPAQRRAAKRLSAGSVSRKRAGTGKRTVVKRGPRSRGAR